MLKAIAFDIDGTLYSESLMMRRSIWFALSRWRLLRTFARVRIHVRSVRPIEDLYRLQARLTAEALGEDPETIGRRIHEQIYLRWEENLRRVPLLPGVKDALRTLRTAGYRLGAMSDFPVTRKLELFNLDSEFDVAFSSEETHYLKPNPEPFLELARRLDVDPGEMLYVGNSYHYDVLGAARVGMKTAHLSKRCRHDNPPDICFDRYGDLIGRIFQMDN